MFFHVVLLACRGASPVFIGKSIAASANKSRHPQNSCDGVPLRDHVCFPPRLFGVASQISKSWQCCSNQHRQIAAGTLLGQFAASAAILRPVDLLRQLVVAGLLLAIVLAGVAAALDSARISRECGGAFARGLQHWIRSVSLRACDRRRQRRL